MFESENKNYLIPSDRRFKIEKEEGILPMDLTLKNNSKEGLKDIPEQTYDLQNGFFDPVTNIVYNYDRTQIIKRVNNEESQKIKELYRYQPGQFFSQKERFDDSID